MITWIDNPMTGVKDGNHVTILKGTMSEMDEDYAAWAYDQMERESVADDERKCAEEGCKKEAPWRDADGNDWCNAHRHSLVALRVEPTMSKPKYRFLHRANGVYYWENTKKVDSRVEQIYCGVEWFWGGKKHFWIEQMRKILR